MQNLLKEGISIRDLLTIFETLADYAPSTRDTDILTEYVRQSLKRAISNKFFPPNETTSVVTLDPKIEQEIMASVKQTENGAYLQSWKTWGRIPLLLLLRLSVCISND